MRLAVVSQNGLLGHDIRSQCSRVIIPRISAPISMYVFRGRTTLLVSCTSKVRSVIAIGYHAGESVWSLDVAAL